MTTLAQAARGQRWRVTRVGGGRAFRRRLMELGLVPGTPVEVVGAAPLGDPIELLVRGCSLSVRRGEAAEVAVEPAQALVAAPAAAEPCTPVCAACHPPRGA